MATTTQRDAFRNRITYRAGNRSDLTDAQKDQWLDGGMHDLSLSLRIRQLEDVDTSKSFVVADNTMTLPTDAVAVLHIRNSTEDQPLTHIPWTRFEKIRIVDGTPRLWTNIGETLYFDKNPTATDSLRMIVVKQHNWGGTGSSTPPIDAQFDYGLELLAALHMFRDLGSEAKAELIESSQQPRTGQFWSWVQANRHPILVQGLASQDREGVRVMGLSDMINEY